MVRMASTVSANSSRDEYQNPLSDSFSNDDALEALRQLLRIPTISRPATGPGPRTDPAPFEAFIAALPTLFPRVHAALELERVGGDPDHGDPGCALLYRWRGTDAAGAAEPTVLMAHYDVVPATDEGWQHPPFAAEIVGDGDAAVLWGRGTLDDKGCVVAILSAVERLLAVGHAPRHDVLLCFGNDEEVFGTGARSIVDVLRERSIRPSLVLDEGGAIVREIFPGVDEDYAVIGVTEKGITTLRLRVDEHGGHAASPPAFAATERLSRAILRLNRRPSRARLGATTRTMIRTLGSRARQPLRTVFAAVDVLAPLLTRVFVRRGAETAALTRTTRAVTELRAGHAHNALAESAEATLNMRIAPWSSVEEAVEEVRRAIADDAVRIEVVEASEPSPVSPDRGEAWDDLVASIRAVHPGLLVTPYVMMQASDARWFTAISDHVYRFAPFRMSGEERACLHAKDERMRVAAFLDGIEVYRALLERR